MSDQQIVIGVDGTAESACAAAFGLGIAQHTHNRCTLVFAGYDYDTMLGAWERPRALEATRDAQARDREAIAVSLRGSVPASIIDTLEIRSGSPAVVLREAAERLHAGLIVVGSRKHRGLERLRASLVSNLVRTCDVPVLVASGSPAIRRILVALDLSDASESVLLVAQQWARRFGAHMRLLHVVEPMPVMPHASIELVEEYHRADERLRETGIWAQIDEHNAEKVVRAGLASTVITRDATEWRADLVVVGSHGASWSERLLVGSTVQNLLDDPPVPTLVVPVGAPAARDRPLAIGAMPWETQTPVSWS